MKTNEDIRPPHTHELGLADSPPDRWGVRSAAPLGRRHALRLLAGAGVVALAGCATKGSTSTTAALGSTTSTAAGATTTAAATAATGTSTTAASTATADVSSAIPEETAGPYPGDGSNGPNVLTQSGVVRSDIRSSFGSSTKVATGIPYTIKLQIVKAGTGAAMAGAAVYVWHCDKDGNYSMYSQGVTNENYLRGVQETDSNGYVTFQSIFPACYSGRWPHVHFEVFPSLVKATSASNKIATSQLALPEDIDTLVYATNGYSTSVRNLSQVSLKTDNVFSDGWSRETPTFSGNVTSGFVSTMVVPVKA